MPSEPPVEAPKTSILSGFMLEGLMGQPSSDNSLDIEQFISSDRFKQEAEKEADLSRITLDSSISLEQKFKQLVDRSAAPIRPKSFGEVYQEALFPGSEEVATEDTGMEVNGNPATIANVMDFHTTQRMSNDVMANLLDAPSMEEWFRTPINFAVRIPTFFGITDSKTIQKGFAKLIELRRPEFEARKAAKKAAIEKYGTLVGGLIGGADLNPLVTARNALNLVVNGVNIFNGEIVELRTNKDFANYLAMVPDPTGPLPDALMGEFLERLFDIGSGEDTFSPEFSAKLEKTYGKDWEWRMAAFAGVEFGIDTAALIIAATIPGAGAVMFPKKIAGAIKYTRRIKAAITRSAAIGAIGTPLHAVLNEGVDRDFDIEKQLIVRSGGALFGEAALGSLRALILAGVKGTGIAGRIAGQLLPRSVSRWAADFGAEVMSPNLWRATTDARASATSPLGVAARASREATTTEMRRMRTKLVDGIFRPSEASAIQNEAQTKIAAQLVNLDSNTQADEMAIRTSLGEVIHGKSLKDAIAFKEQHVQLKRDLKKAETKWIAARDKFRQQDAIRTSIKKQREATPGAAVDAPTARDAKALVAGKEAVEARKAYESLYKITKELEYRAPTGFTTGSSLGDAVILEQAVGQRIIGQTMEAVGAQEESARLWVQSMKGDEFIHRPPEINEGGISRSVTGFVGMTDQVLPELGSAKDFAQVNRNITRYRKELTVRFRAAIANLSGRERDAVERVLQKGADDEIFYNEPAQLLAFGLNPKQQDAYYAVRGVLDDMHLINDTVISRELRGLGYKKRTDGMIVKINTKDLSKEQKAKGLVNFETIPTTGNQAKRTGTMNSAELSEVNTFLPYQEGYIPINYTRAAWHVSVIDSQLGTVRRLAGFPSYKKAKAYMREQAFVDANKSAEKITGVNSGTPKNPRERFVVFTDKFDERTNLGQSAIAKTSVNLIDAADTATINNIERAIREAGSNIRVASLRVILDDLTGTSLRRQNIGSRAAERLKGEATPKMAFEAVVDYIEATATRAGTNDWRVYSQDLIVRMYGPGGRGILKPGDSWDTKVPLREIAARDFNQWRDLGDWQSFVKRAISFRTSHERTINRWGIAITQTLGDSKNPVARAFSNIYDVYFPDNTKMLNAFRGIGSVTKLGLLAPSQFFVQASQVMLTVGVSPLHIAGGVTDVIKASVAAVKKARGGKLSADEEQLLQAINLSGLANDFSTNDIVTLAMGTKSSLVRMMEHYGATAGAGRFAAQKTAGLGKFIVNATSVPFKGGEALNRILAFTTSRRKMVSRLQNGKLLGFDGKPFRGKIDDDEFIRITADHAQQTFLNMSRSGQIKGISGWGGLLFQFRQIGAFTTGVATSKVLTGAEKLSGAAFAMGMMGPQALPMVYSTLNLVDWLAWNVTGRPTDREYATRAVRDGFSTLVDWALELDDSVLLELGASKKVIERMATKGFIFTATDGEIDLVSRVTTGRFLAEWMESAADGDLFVLWGILAQFGDAVPNIWELITAYRETVIAEPGSPAASGLVLAHNIAGEVGKVITSVGGFARSMESLIPEVLDPRHGIMDPEEIKNITTSSGTVLPVEANRTRAVLQFLGVAPGPQTRFRTVQDATAKRRNALKEYMKDQLKDMRAARDDPTRRARIMAETQSELQAFEAQAYTDGLQGIVKNTRGSWVKSQLGRLMRAWLRKDQPDREFER